MSFSMPAHTLDQLAVEYTDYFSAAPPPKKNEYPVYDTKQSDGEVLVMLELWGMR